MYQLKVRPVSSPPTPPLTLPLAQAHPPSRPSLPHSQEYEPIYRATLSAEAAALTASSNPNNPNPSPATNSTRRKRAGDEDSDEDETGGGQDPSMMMSDGPESTSNGEWSHKPERRMPRVEQR